MTSEDLVADIVRLKKTYGITSAVPLLVCHVCRQPIVTLAIGTPGVVWCEACWIGLEDEREQQLERDRRDADGKDPS